jgi:hypothetical protein
MCGLPMQATGQRDAASVGLAVRSKERTARPRAIALGATVRLK